MAEQAGPSASSASSTSATSTFRGSRKDFHRHRRRLSNYRSSVDTITPLPEYTSVASSSSIRAPLRSNVAQWAATLEPPLDNPPDYPDSADDADADEETDECVPLSVAAPLSPRRDRQRHQYYRPFRYLHRSSGSGSSRGSGSVDLRGGDFLRGSSGEAYRGGDVRSKGLKPQQYPQPKNYPYSNPGVSASDTFLDSLLERSVNALELSNALLQSSNNSMGHESPELTALNNTSDVSININVGNITKGKPAPDQLLDFRARALSSRISNSNDRWRQDLDTIISDVDALCRDERKPRKSNESEFSISQSLPNNESFAQRRGHRRPPSIDIHRSNSDGMRLRRATVDTPPSTTSTPGWAPRPMTQYVSVESNVGNVVEATANQNSIFMPSTLGLRSSSHVSDFTPTQSPNNLQTPSPTPSSAQQALMALAGKTLSRSSSLSSRFSRSPTPQAHDKQRQAGRSPSIHSRTSGMTASPPVIPLAIPPLIEELPSNSDSSSSSSQDLTAKRTMEQLRKILDEQPPPDPKGKKSERPAFAPRSAPVEAVSGTSTTTTSISRLFTKGSHSTSTRAPSPPRHSSLKNRSPMSASPSTLSIPEAGSISCTSSGRSTPHKVVFGPLPESYVSSKGGSSPRFSAKKKRKGKERREDNESDSSWWTTWLAGGSLLSMNAARYEEKVEDRMARGWGSGRPGGGGGTMEDWGV